MAIFDENKYNEYLTNNDYSGLATYMRNFQPKDKTKRAEFNRQIEILKRQGAINNALINNEPNADYKAAMAFNIQRPHGKYDMSNPFTKRYINAINQIGNTKNEVADYFDYEFKSNDYYNKFIKNSGMKIGEYNPKSPTNIYHYNKDGKNIVRVHRASFRNPKMFDAINKGLNSITVSEAVQNNPMLGLFAGSQIGFNTKSYDANGKQLTNYIGFDKYQKEAANYANVSADIYKKRVKKAYDKVTPAKLMVSGFMCDAQRQLQIAAMNNQIDNTSYNTQIKIINDFYKNRLANEDISSYDEVYLKDENTGNLYITNEKTKNDLTEAVRTAIDENRISVVAGASGGRTGTVISISANPDSKGNVADSKYKKSFKIFVPGLFDKDARNLINKNSDAKLMVEIADHQMYGHDYDLVEGGKLSKFDGNGGAIYVTDKGERPLDPKQVQDVMKRNILIEGGITNALNQVDLDKNNRVIPGQTELMDKIKEYSINAFTDLYNVNPSRLNEILEDENAINEINKINNTILKNIGVYRIGTDIK